MISLKYRMEAYETIGRLFKDVKQDYIEQKLNERIFSAIIEVLIVLDFLGVDFDYKRTISKLVSYSENTKLFKDTGNIPIFCKLVA